eukprot:scaffold37839_cov22-Tisochrysis_lutea.AAC.3
MSEGALSVRQGLMNCRDLLRGASHTTFSKRRPAFSASFYTSLRKKRGNAGRWHKLLVMMARLSQRKQAMIRSFIILSQRKQTISEETIACFHASLTRPSPSCKQVEVFISAQKIAIRLWVCPSHAGSVDQSVKAIQPQHGDINNNQHSHPHQHHQQHLGQFVNGGREVPSAIPGLPSPAAKSARFAPDLPSVFAATTERHATGLITFFHAVTAPNT